MRTSFFTRSALVAVGALTILGLGTASASAQDLNEILDTVNLGDAVTTNISGPGDDAVSQNAASADPNALLDESTLAGIDPTGSVPMSSVSDLTNLGDVTGDLTGELESAPSATHQSAHGDRVGSGVEDLVEAVDTESVVTGLQDVASPAAGVDAGEISATPQREEQSNPLGDVTDGVSPVGDQVNGTVSDLGETVTDSDVTGDVVTSGDGVVDTQEEVEGVEVAPQSATGDVQSLVEGVTGGLGGSLL